VPEIDIEPVDFTPPNVFYSPGVQSEWDSGVVTIQKEERQELLDFNILRSKIAFEKIGSLQDVAGRRWQGL